jgi:hypothetical protein
MTTRKMVTKGTRFHTGSHRKVACKMGNRAERRYVRANLQSKDWKDYGPKWWTQEFGHEMMWNYHQAPNDWDSYQDKGKRAWVNPWDWD